MTKQEIWSQLHNHRTAESKHSMNYSITHEQMSHKLKKKKKLNEETLEMNMLRYGVEVFTE